MPTALEFFASTTGVDVHKTRLVHADHPQGSEMRLVSTAREHGVTKGKVLDICAGAGAVSKAFTAHEYDCHAVDGSVEMIKLCQTHLPKDRTHLINFETEEWPFNEGGFDVAVSIRGLFYLNNGNKVIGKMLQSLRPGGIFIADFLSHEEDTTLPIEGRYKGTTPDLDMPVYSLSEPSINTLARNFGARVLNYEGFQANDRFNFDQPIYLNTWVMKKDGP